MWHRIAVLFLLGAGASCAAPPTHAPAARAEVDYACRTDADCAVKNVGNCCGEFPACVNAASPTFPERVKAECKRDGVASVCGFREIASCACVASRCAATGDSAKGNDPR